MLSALYVIVHPSVTRVDHTKTVEVGIMKFLWHGSPIPLVLQGKFHQEILRGSPERGRQTSVGWDKSAIF